MTQPIGSCRNFQHSFLRRRTTSLAIWRDPGAIRRSSSTEKLSKVSELTVVNGADHALREAAKEAATRAAARFTIVAEEFSDSLRFFVNYTAMKTTQGEWDAELRDARTPGQHIGELVVVAAAVADCDEIDDVVVVPPEMSAAVVEHRIPHFPSMFAPLDTNRPAFPICSHGHWVLLHVDKIEPGKASVEARLYDSLDPGATRSSGR